MDPHCTRLRPGCICAAHLRTHTEAHLDPLRQLCGSGGGGGEPAVGTDEGPATEVSVAITARRSVASVVCSDVRVRPLPRQSHWQIVRR